MFRKICGTKAAEAEAPGRTGARSQSVRKGTARLRRLLQMHRILALEPRLRLCPLRERDSLSADACYGAAGNGHPLLLSIGPSIRDLP